MTAKKRPGRPRKPDHLRVSRYTVLLTPQQYARVLRYGPTVSAGVNRILRTIFEAKGT